MKIKQINIGTSKYCSVNWKRQPITIVTTVSLLLGGMGAFSTASAQDGTVIEEIVVTAQKRGAQSIQEIPMSVSALDGDRLHDMGATSFMDYAGIVPGLQFQDLGPGDKEYIIRGANSSGGSTAAVYFDEAIITGRNKEDGGGRQPDIKLYDMERIEVLKGPQGTLYGASALTGTIRMITNKPDPTEFAGFVEVEFSDTEKGGGNNNYNGWVNLPLIEDKLAIRAVGWVNRDSGFVDQVRLPNNNINDEDVEGGRLTLRWLPTENITLTGGIVSQSMASGGSSRFTPGDDFFVGDPPNGFIEASGCDLCNVDFTQSRWDENLDIYHATLEWETDYGTLLATTNKFKRDIDFQFDGTPILFFLFDLFGFDNSNPFGLGPLATSITRQPQDRELWSNEIRFSSDLDGPFNFVVGAFLSRENKNFTVEVTTANSLGEIGGQFNATDPSSDLFAGGPTIFGRTRTVDTDQEALFADGTFQVSENLELVAGIRWFQADIQSEEEQTKPFGGFPPSEGFPINTVDFDADDITFRAGVSYHATDNHLLYFMYSEGFREGGVNDFGIPQIAQIPRTFDSDELTNLEIGAKTEWLDNRLIMNIAIFHTEWDNALVEIRDRTEAFKFLADGGDVEIDGVEFELIAQPAEGLSINASLAWTDARLVRSSPFAAGVPDPDNPGNPFIDPNAGIEGDDVPNVPEWQFGVTASYVRPILGGKAVGMIRFDWAYYDDRANQYRPFKVDSNEQEITVGGQKVANPFYTKLDSYSLLNASAGISWDDWRATVFVDNVTDKRAEIDAIRSNQDPLGFLTVRPRTAGIRISKSF